MHPSSLSILPFPNELQSKVFTETEETKDLAETAPVWWWSQARRCGFGGLEQCPWKRQVADRETDIRLRLITSNHTPAPFVCSKLLLGSKMAQRCSHAKEPTSSSQIQLLLAEKWSKSLSPSVLLKWWGKAEGTQVCQLRHTTLPQGRVCAQEHGDLSTQLMPPVPGSISASVLIQPSPQTSLCPPPSSNWFQILKHSLMFNSPKKPACDHPLIQASLYLPITPRGQ